MESTSSAKPKILSEANRIKESEAELPHLKGGKY